MEGKLIKVEDGYLLIDVNTSNEDRWSVIGSYPFNKDVEKLSLKNCQAIENGYDLDELYEKVVNSDFSDKYEDGVHYYSFIEGFQKAVEILGDKKFSEEDVKKTLYLKNGFDKDGFSFYKSDEEIIQSLQQTEWDVEIVMECPQCKEYGYISECRNVCNKKFTQPKLDADGCLILKRK